MAKILDSDAVRTQVEQAERRYRVETVPLPRPLWAKRGFEDDGRRAWDVLRQEFPPRTGDEAIAVYIHIPFCDRKCRFCDCYSLHARKRGGELQQRYVDALLFEIDSWATVPVIEGRVVSTVHFGGGTPLFLLPHHFDAILSRIKKKLRVGPATELAVETTSSLLGEEPFARLRDLGFSRLHVGVQTLDDTMRRSLGRKEPGAVVLTKLEQSLKQGFVTTVDILYGLPRQTAGGLLDALHALADTGVDGFSLYRLNRTGNNMRRLKAIDGTGPIPLQEYLLFQIGHEYLLERGFRKNHFAHFSSPRERNLYYTHLTRGEDLLALGATADGAFGTYHYRHPTLPDYARSLEDMGMNLDGGLRESRVEQRYAQVVVELMAAVLRKETFEMAGIGHLLEEWARDALVVAEPLGSSYTLTANGSWFVSRMIEEAVNHVNLLYFQVS